MKIEYFMLEIFFRKMPTIGGYFYGFVYIASVLHMHICTYIFYYDIDTTFKIQYNFDIFLLCWGKNLMAPVQTYTYRLIYRRTTYFHLITYDISLHKYLQSPFL